MNLRQFLAMLFIGVLASGCAHDNGIIITPSPKSTAAENAKAYGEIAAGAWDRLFKGSE